MRVRKHRSIEKRRHLAYTDEASRGKGIPFGAGIAVLHREANHRKVQMTQSTDKCMEFQVMTFCKIQLRLLFSRTHHNMKKEIPDHCVPYVQYSIEATITSRVGCV